jgi:hypothetical protein
VASSTLTVATQQTREVTCLSNGTTVLFGVVGLRGRGRDGVDGGHVVAGGGQRAASESSGPALSGLGQHASDTSARDFTDDDAEKTGEADPWRRGGRNSQRPVDGPGQNSHDERQRQRGRDTPPPGPGNFHSSCGRTRPARSMPANPMRAAMGGAGDLTRRRAYTPPIRIPADRA